MNRELRSLLHKLDQKKTEVRALLNDNKVDEAQTLMEEVRNLQVKVDKLRAEEDEFRSSFGGGRPLNDDEYREESGESVRVLKLEQRMSDLAQPYVIDGEKRQLSIGKYVRGLVTGDWQGAHAEQRAMSEGVLTGGGYLVPTQLSSQLIDVARNQARVMQAGALTVPMDSNKMTIARVVDGPTVHWKKENDRITEGAMSFDAVNLVAKTLVGMARMSVELFEDAANIDKVVSDAISQALALELDRVGLFGSGTDPEPRGLYLTTGIQKIDMGTNGAALTNYAKFSEAVETVQNVNGQPNGIIWAPRTAGAIDRLVDSTGQPLRAPASFEGLQKFATNQVPTDMSKGTATNASVAFVGDWTKLLFGMRTNLILEVSRQAAGAFEHLQVLIRAYLRADMAVMKPDHFVVIDGIIPAQS